MITPQVISLGVAAVLVFLELLYVVSQKPSYYQITLSICLASLLVWVAGYVIELEYSAIGNKDMAILGTRISYLGKPFTMLSMLFFLAQYCDINVPKWVSVLLVILHSLVSLSAFTCVYHKLFYTSIGFNQKTMSLVLGHGPVYYLYMAMVIGFFVANIAFGIHSLRRVRGKKDFVRELLVFLLIFTGVAGYLIFLFGITGGFDTTVIGCVLSAFFLFMLFWKYHLFDTITVAKEQMLDSLEDAFIVENAKGNLEYANQKAKELLPGLPDRKKQADTLREIEGLSSLGELFFRDDKVYAISNHAVYDDGTYYGRVYEFKDITERYRYASRLQEEVERKTRHISDMQYRIIESFASMIEARDEVTGEHINHCSMYVAALCKELDKRHLFPDETPENFCTVLGHVAPLHDVGKIALPDSILKSPSRLNEEEFAIVKTHTTIGAVIIGQTFKDIESEEYVDMARDVAKYHHERWDGTGYPEGRKGMAIPFSAQIMAICDVYDALRSIRPYKEAYSKQKAMEIITAERGKQFNPDITDAFLDVVKDMP